MDFMKDFENKVRNTVKDYKLATKKDKIIVACSGGKDSTVVLYLLKKFGYNVEGLIIDLLIGKWSDDNLENAKKFCKEQKIKLNIVNIRKEFGCSICHIRMGIQSKKKLNNCMICGVIKRWLLNKKSREQGGTKLVTGHNLDDEAETLLMNLFTGNPELMLGFGPKRNCPNKKFVHRIKPLFFCTNDEIRKYSKAKKFPVLYDPCPCSHGAFRSDAREFIAELEKKEPGTKEKLVRNFLKILPKLQEQIKLGVTGRRSEGAKKENLKTEKLETRQHCAVCKEPTMNELCKRCELIKILGLARAK